MTHHRARSPSKDSMRSRRLRDSDAGSHFESVCHHILIRQKFSFWKQVLLFLGTNISQSLIFVNFPNKNANVDPCAKISKANTDVIRILPSQINGGNMPPSRGEFFSVSGVCSFVNFLFLLGNETHHLESLGSVAHQPREAWDRHWPRGLASEPPRLRRGGPAFEGLEPIAGVGEGHRAAWRVALKKYQDPESNSRSGAHKIETGVVSHVPFLLLLKIGTCGGSNFANWTTLEVVLTLFMGPPVIPPWRYPRPCRLGRCRPTLWGLERRLRVTMGWEPTFGGGCYMPPYKWAPCLFCLISSDFLPRGFLGMIQENP